ncbi:MAG TPA: helix-turn-helix domain-containing protein [Burkholderiales bacterium]|nr:helix-turn-helix domain-containing protein [Burkholderiales bacterium]
MNEPVLRADARANRTRLIEAAHAVFRERGLDAETKEIAELAGVGIATLYRNFATREELVAAMVAEVQERMQRTVRVALAQDDAIDGIRSLLQAGFAMLDEYGYLMTVFHESMHEDSAKHLSKQHEILSALGALVQKGVAAGVLRRNLDVELAALRILTSFLPPIYQHLRETRDVETIVDAQIQLLLHGMATNP